MDLEYVTAAPNGVCIFRDAEGNLGSYLTLLGIKRFC